MYMYITVMLYLKLKEVAVSSVNDGTGALRPDHFNDVHL